MSQNNPGTSINFDAQALHDADEAEYHREEKERENELRAALMNAFDDDLSDGDSDMSHDHGTSIVSHDTDAKNRPQSANSDDAYKNVGSEVAPERPQDVQLPTATPFPSHGALQHHLATHTSTPLNGLGAPPLTTPADAYYHGNQQWNQNHDYQSYGNQGNYGDYQYVGEGYYGDMGHLVTRPDVYERGEIEGANDEDNRYVDGHGHHGNNNQFPSNQQHYEHGNEYEGNYAYYPETNYMPETQTYPQPEVLGPSPPEPDTQVTAQTTEDNNNIHKVSQPKTSIPGVSPSQDLESYKVTYLGSNIVVPRPKDKLATGGAISPSVTPPRPTTPGGDYDDLQKVFLNTGSNHQLEQLQILYAARGRKLEEVTQQLRLSQDDSDREIRILKHKLTLAQDERDGLSSSLDQCQQLLKDSKYRDADAEGKITALESKINALTAAKEQLVQTLRSQETTVESLNAELRSLEASESLTRARDQHQAALSSLKQKHDADIYILKEHLDKTQGSNEEKDTEIQNLRKQVTDLRKTAEDSQINRADTINRLTRSLEDSQTQCRDLLESGAGQELSKLRIQLQDVIASCSISDDLNSALQDEIKELKEQVMMYESVSQFTTIGQVSNVQKHVEFDDSYAQLGIRNSVNQWPTPDTNRTATPTMSSEDTIHGLKAELERCLQMYKSKRQTVTALQDELKATKACLDINKANMATAQQEAKEAKERLKQLEDKLGDAVKADNPREVLTRREIDKLTNERDTLAAQLEDVRIRLEETAANEEQISAHNKELNTRMSDMIQEFDEDKRQALDKCQEAVLQHHEEMRNRLEQELKNQFDQEKMDLEKQWQNKYNTAISDSQVMQKDLDDVKNLYVVVCREKDQLEEQLGQEFAQKLEQQITEMKEKLEAENEVKLEELKMTLTSSSQTSLSITKEKWAKEQEADVTRRIESKVAHSKAEWFAEHQAARDQAVERALKVCGLEWQQKWDTELHQRVEQELDNVQRDWDEKQQVELHRQLEERLAADRATWRQTELQDVVAQVKEEALVQATREIQDHQKAVEDAVSLARQQWLREQQLTETQTHTQTDDHDTSVDQQGEKASSTPTHLQESYDNLKLELDKIRSEKMLIEQQLENIRSEKSTIEQQWSVQKAAWLEERNQLEKVNNQLAQDKDQLVQDKDQLLQDKDQLVQDQEERIKQAEEHTEAQYRQFLEEHRDTLTKALATAHQQHDFQMEELKAQIRTLSQDPNCSVDAEGRTKNERKKLREEWEACISEMTAKHDNERIQWEARISEITAEHEADRSELISLHRENMTKALDEARKRWQKKLDGELQERGEQTLLVEREAEWAQERAQYINIIRERDELLQAADTHMEAEISKLHHQIQHQIHAENQGQRLLGGEDHIHGTASDVSNVPGVSNPQDETGEGRDGRMSQEEFDVFQNTLQAEYQEHLQATMQDLEDTLNRQHEEMLHTEITKLEETHETNIKTLKERLKLEYQTEIECKLEQLKCDMNSEHEENQRKLQQDLEKDFASRFHASQAEMEKVLSKLEDTRKQLKELYSKYTKDTKNLARKVEFQEQELNKAKELINEYQKTIKDQNSEKQELYTKMEDLSKQVEKAEKLRQEVVETLKKSEAEHEDIVSSYKTRCTELNERSQRADALFKVTKAQSQQQLLNLQESLEHQHNTVIDKLQAKMVEMNQKHTEKIRKLRKQHDHETEHLIMETSMKDDSAVHDMRDQYLEAVEKIREDVVKHMSQSNERAASTVRIQVIRERQLTARRLRRYYMKCLAHILDKDCDPLSKEHKLQAMERYMDNLPERDGSRSTTPSVPSSSNSQTHTPVNKSEDYVEAGRSYEIMNSSGEIPDYNKFSHSAGHSHSTSASSSRPTSGTSAANDSWVTRRSRGTKPSSMTYPVPSLKNSSPAGNGKPPAGPDKRHSRGKSLEEQVQELRSQLQQNMDLGLSVSTPNLTPRQVGFSDLSHRRPDGDVSHHEDKDNVSVHSVHHSQVSDDRYNRPGAAAKSIRHSVNREESPLDDILDKYAIGTKLPSRPTSAGDGDLPDSAKSTPGRTQFSLPRTNQAQMNLSKSTEFLYRDTQGLSTAPVLSTATGYRYTSLRNILNTRGQSKSSSNLNHLSDNTYSIPSNPSNRLDLRTPPPPTTKYRTPPERLPAQKQQSTPPKPTFVPRLQLQMLDVDLDKSDNQESITPRADREVANYNSSHPTSVSVSVFQGSKLSLPSHGARMAPPNFGFQAVNDPRTLSVQRPVPLITRHTQAP